MQRLPHLFAFLLLYVAFRAGAQPAPEFGTTTQEEQKIQELLEASREMELENPEEAKRLSKLALELAEVEGDPAELAKSLYRLGTLLIREGRYQEASPYIARGLENAIASKDQELTAWGHYHLSKIHEEVGDFAGALNQIRQASQLFESIEKTREVAFCLTSQGRIYHKIGDNLKALTFFLESLRIKEFLEDMPGIAVTKSNIGNVYLNSQRYEEAIEMFSEALAIDREIGDAEGIMIGNLNLGATYSRLDQFSKAEEYFRASLDKAVEMGYYYDQAILLKNIGNLHRKQSKTGEGLVWLNRALKLQRQYGYNRARTLADIAEAHLTLNQLDSAEYYASAGVSVARDREDLEYLHKTQALLASILRLQGRHAEALEALMASNAIRDSLFSMERDKKLSELQISYETEKKDAEISLLTLREQASRFRIRALAIIGFLACLTLFLMFYYHRARSLRNKKLLAREKELSDMKTRFFSNISHEFRTPLTLILGPIELLKEKVSNPGLRTYLDKMQLSAQRLLTLINQLLDLSKIEAGGFQANMKPLDIVTLVKGVSMSFTSLMETKNIEMQVSSSNRSLQVKGDQEKLETILINLLSNAFKYSGENGSIQVSLNHNGADVQREVCEILISDNGCGIPEEALDHIFDRYYRGQGSDNSIDSGYGIGLALTKELVELHQGTIHIQSRVNEGTRVIVQFPILETVESNVGYATSPKPIASPLPKILSGTKSGQDQVEHEQRKSGNLVLIIEDNEDVLFYLKSILSENYDLISASNGSEGISLGVEHIPDLIICDVMMPGIDGYQVCSRLKRDERTSHVPIVMLTAKATQEDRLKGLSQRADIYLTKPFFPKELLLHVANLISSRNALRERYSREVILKPDQVLLNSIDEKFLRKVRKVVDDHLDNEDFNMEKLGADIGMSRSQIHRKLQALTNQSATQFIRSYRLERAYQMLRQKAGNISEIAYAVGFSDPSYFSKCFSEQYKMSPSQVYKTV